MPRAQSQVVPALLRDQAELATAMSEAGLGAPLLNINGGLVGVKQFVASIAAALLEAGAAVNQATVDHKGAHGRPDGRLAAVCGQPKRAFGKWEFSKI